MTRNFPRRSASKPSERGHRQAVWRLLRLPIASAGCRNIFDITLLSKIPTSTRRLVITSAPSDSAFVLRRPISRGYRIPWDDDLGKSAIHVANFDQAIWSPKAGTSIAAICTQPMVNFCSRRVPDIVPIWLLVQTWLSNFNVDKRKLNYKSRVLRTSRIDLSLRLLDQSKVAGA